MSQRSRPSYEDLEAVVEARDARVAELEALAGWQEERISALEVLVGRLVGEKEELLRRVSADSSNSSRPPSSDSPYDKPKPKRSGLRGRSGRRPGKS
jgi:transposase